MGYAGNLPTYNSFPSDLFTGNGSNTNFTMSSVPGNDAALLVTIDGVRQHTDTYSYSSNTLIFSEAPPSGAIIETVNMGSRADVIITDGVYRKTQFTATNAQTNFNIATGYTVGFVDVYLNGIRLVVADDYTATDGSTVILASPAATGDSVEVVAYGTFNVANALQKSGDTMSGNFVVAGSVQVSNGITSQNTYTGAYADGIVVDYTNGTGRISVGTADGLTIYNGGIANVALMSIAANGSAAFTNVTSIPAVVTPVGSGLSAAYTAQNATAIYPTVNTGAAYPFLENSNLIIQRNSDRDFIVGGLNGSTLQQELVVKRGGYVTTPYQPMFDVYKNNGNVAASQTIIFNGVRSNVGNCYNTSTGRFTAPVAGAYQFNTQVTTADSGAFLEIQLAVNGSLRNYSSRTYRNGSVQDSTGLSISTYLSAGDYVTVTTSVGNAYGVDERCALFSGHLIG